MRKHYNTIGGIDIELMDEAEGQLFSEWIGENYNKCLEVAKKFVDLEHYEDLVQDVWMGFKKREINECLRYTNQIDEDGKVVGIDRVVFGVMKAYSKNERYYTASEGVSYDERGRVVYKEIAATAMEDDLDKLSGIQKAYATMGSYDDIEWTEQVIDLAENLRFLVNYDLGEQKFMFPVINVLNMCIESLVNGDIKEDILSKLGDMAIFRTAGKEFREAFSNVIKAASRDIDSFAVAAMAVANEM